jgi:hypothetical protein
MLRGIFFLFSCGRDDVLHFFLVPALVLVLLNEGFRSRV